MPVNQPRTRRKVASEEENLSSYTATDNAVGDTDVVAPSGETVPTYDESQTRLCNLCGKAFHTDAGFRSHLKVGLNDRLITFIFIFFNDCLGTLHRTRAAKFFFGIVCQNHGITCSCFVLLLYQWLSEVKLSEFVEPC
jgi:hypothetical protein